MQICDDLSVAFGANSPEREAKGCAPPEILRIEG